MAMAGVAAVVPSPHLGYARCIHLCRFWFGGVAPGIYKLMASHPVWSVRKVCSVEGVELLEGVLYGVLECWSVKLWERDEVKSL